MKLSILRIHGFICFTIEYTQDKRLKFKKSWWEFVWFVLSSIPTLVVLSSVKVLNEEVEQKSEIFKLFSFSKSGGLSIFLNNDLPVTTALVNTSYNVWIKHLDEKSSGRNCENWTSDTIQSENVTKSHQICSTAFLTTPSSSTINFLWSKSWWELAWVVLSSIPTLVFLSSVRDKKYAYKDDEDKEKSEIFQKERALKGSLHRKLKE
ncbi:CLUMA_CG001117, isoform A [Clunio marinus]|uniref:CLUMA_CG001117, isoform A n=1 Tax=Clunio marinus TaxID=568069 RepID=A0A1J1HHF9_9DIPT|nr:CLUMA_CG001117, isoform A [Clunio marinus]